MRRILFTLLLLAQTITAFSQEKTDTLFYNKGESKLSKIHKKQLAVTLSLLDIKALTTIKIYGHADSVGASPHNEKLSAERANKVEEYLLKKGIEKKKITLVAYGETQPLNNNKKEDKNRRVEISFVTTAKEYAPIEEFYKKSTLKPQEFAIDPSRDTVIRCEKGTIIQIKANSFKTTSNSTINFQVKEAFLKSEMILENLSTTANGQILETQGMVYTNALSGNETLELQKDLLIMVPTDTILPGMKIFEGDRDAHSDVMNWSLSNNSILQNFTVQQVADCPYFMRCLYQDGISGCDSMYKYDSIAINQCRANCMFGWMGCGGDRDGRCRLFFCKIIRFINYLKMSADEKRTRKKNKEIVERAQKNNGLLTRADIDAIQMDLFKKKNDNKKLSEDEEKVLELTNIMQESDQLIQSGAINTKVIAQCQELDSLFKLYGVKNTNALVAAINKPLMDKLGVKTMKELLDTLPKVNMQNLEVAYRNKEISYTDFKFYVFNSSKLGWKNCDIFADIPADKMITLKVDLIPSETVDCKLVFKSRQFVLPAKIIQRTNFYFDGVPEGELAWIVAIRYDNGKPMLGLKEITVQKNTFKIDLKEMSLDELKEALKVLDFEEEK